jgi:hypothetical protein
MRPHLMKKKEKEKEKERRQLLGSQNFAGRQ